MNYQKSMALIFFLFLSLFGAAQEDEDYVEFNDRKNTVHGIYLGLSTMYGELNGLPTYGFGFKTAYVANQKFEVGFAINLFQSDQPLIVSNTVENKLTGGYLGVHLEPILFSDQKVSLSFPVLIGIGGIGYFANGSEDFDDDVIDAEFDDLNTIFVLEPGVSFLLNISRYLQLEAGIKYRLTNNFDLPTSPIENLNGFSAGIGFKVGVFNMGRNRYKKKLEE